MRGSAVQGVLGFDCGGSAHLPTCCGSQGTTSLQLVSGAAQGMLQGTPCPAVPFTGGCGRTWSLVLGICCPVTPGLKEGGSRQFACLGLWLSFLPSPPPLPFLCRGGCFSPPRAAVAGWQG